MVTQDHEPEPHELVQTLRDKLANTNLSRDQVAKLVPPSLAKRNCHDIPPYEPGAYRKQCEEARKRQEKLENQRLPGLVPKKLQEKYLNEFYELKAQGKLSHLSPEELEKLEEEIKASASNAKKHAELEEFLSSLNKQTAIPEQQQSVETHDGALPGNKSVTSEEDHSENREKKKSSILKVRAHDGSLVPCFVNFESSTLCDAPFLYTERTELRGRKGPIKVASRTAQEILDALNTVTEYIQHNDLEKYLEGLKELEKILKQKV